MRTNPNGPVTSERLDSLVGKRFHPQTIPKLDLVPTRCPDHLGTGALRSRYKLYQLGPEKLEDIVHSIKVDYLTYKSAADLHNIKPSLVSSIM